MDKREQRKKIKRKNKADFSVPSFLLKHKSHKMMKKNHKIEELFHNQKNKFFIALDKSRRQEEDGDRVNRLNTTMLKTQGTYFKREKSSKKISRKHGESFKITPNSARDNNGRVSRLVTLPRENESEAKKMMNKTSKTFYKTDRSGSSKFGREIMRKQAQSILFKTSRNFDSLRRNRSSNYRMRSGTTNDDNSVFVIKKGKKFSRDISHLKSKKTSYEHFLKKKSSTENNMYHEMDESSAANRKITDVSDQSMFLLSSKLEFNYSRLIKSLQQDEHNTININKNELETLAASVQEYLGAKKNRKRIESRFEIIQILGMIDLQLEQFNSANKIDFQWTNSLLITLSKFLDDCLGGIKKIEAVRGGILGNIIKAWMTLISFICRELSSSITRAELKTVKLSNKVNKKIKTKIDEIHEEVNAMNDLKDEYENKIKHLEKEKYYLSKMVWLMSDREDSLQYALSGILQENTELVNSSVLMELGLLKDKIPSEKKDHLNEIIYDTKSIVQDIKFTFDQTKNKMRRLIHCGMGEVGMRGVKVSSIIANQGTSTDDLITYRTVSTNTVKHLGSYTVKTKTANAGTMVSFKEILDIKKPVKETTGSKFAQEINSDRIKSKKFSSEYHLKNASTLEMIVEYLFGKEGKSQKDEDQENQSRLISTKSILKHPEEYKILPVEVCQRIEASLIEIDKLKMKFNSIGESISNLKYENNELKINNKMYETQNDDLIKKINSLTSELKEMKMKVPRVKPIDWSLAKPEKIKEMINRYLVDAYTEMDQFIRMQEHSSTLNVPSSVQKKSAKRNNKTGAKNFGRQTSLRRQTEVGFNLNLAGLGRKKSGSFSDFGLDTTISCEKVLQKLKEVLKGEKPKGKSKKKKSNPRRNSKISKGFRRQSILSKKSMTSLSRSTNPNLLLAEIEEVEPSSDAGSNNERVNRLVKDIIAYYRIIIPSKQEIVYEKLATHQDTNSANQQSETIKSISQILRLKSIAKKIRRRILISKPSYKISFKIITMTEKNQETNVLSMPQGSIITLFSELLTNLLFEFKINSAMKVKYPLMLYAYELMESTYVVKKLAQNKFKNMVESLNVIVNKKEDEGMSGRELITKIHIFANFLGLGEKWSLDFFDHFLEFLSRFEDPIEIAGNNSSITETIFSESYEIMFNPELCQLNKENRNNLLRMMESIKYMDESQTFYKIEFEPLISHYHYLWKKQKSLVNSILGRLYITYGDREHSKIENWEFMLLMKYIEPQHFDSKEMKKLFYSHADAKLELMQVPAMSLDRFSKLCLIKGYFSKDSERRFHKNLKKLEDILNLEHFTQMYRSVYRNKLRSLLIYFQDEETKNFDKLFEKIDYSLNNPYFYSKRGIQSTYYILYMEIKKGYLNGFIKGNLFPDEYVPIYDQYTKLKKSMNVRITDVALQPLEVKFLASPNTQKA